MKNSNARPATEPRKAALGKLDFVLELPDGRGFDPEPRRSDPDMFIASCEQWLPIVIARPGFWERREAERCPAEFDLADPTRVPVTYPAQFIDELLRR